MCKGQAPKQGAIDTHALTPGIHQMDLDVQDEIKSKVSLLHKAIVLVEKNTSDPVKTELPTSILDRIDWAHRLVV